MGLCGTRPGLALARAAAIGATLLGAAGAARAQPADVSVVSGDARLTADWTAAAGATYDLYIAAESGVSAASVDGLAGGRRIDNVAPPFTLRGLDNNRPYFVVVGEHQGGELRESAEVRAVPRGTWAPTLEGVAAAAVAADPEIDGLYLAAGVGTGAGCAAADKVEGCDIYRSDDGGRTWEVATGGVTRIDIRALAIRGGVAVAGSLSAGAASEKLLRSGNGGASWELSTTGAAQAGAIDKAVAIDPGAPMTFYAGNYVIGSGSRIVKTANGGMAWTPLPEIATGQLSARAIAVSPDDSMVVWLGGGGDPPLAQSLDGGASFAEISVPGVTSVEAIAFHPEMASQIWLAANQAVFVSANGGASFAPRQDGLPAGAVHDLTFALDQDLLLVATSGGVFRSDDGGETYARLGSGLDGDVAAIAYGPDQVVLAATASGVFRLDLTPPAPLAGPADAGVDAMGGGGGGGCGCSGGGAPGSGPLSALLLGSLAALALRRRGRGARAGRRWPGRLRT